LSNFNLIDDFLKLLEVSMVNKIHVVINPASGQPQPILNKLNDVFYPAGVEWDVSITHQSGDATRFAKRAISEGADVVGAYGGDGTVMEVAQAVQKGDVPVAILPGGTANLMSVELGIPKDLTKAARVIVDPDSVVRKVDMGQVGEKQFMLRVGMGFDGKTVQYANRELKDRWGILAYTIAGLKVMADKPHGKYRINVDGSEYTSDGYTCLIYNAGNIGSPGKSASKKINVSDGLLDVFLVVDDSLKSLNAVADSVLDIDNQSDAVKIWQGREITIDCNPPQPMQGDGEIWGETPVTARVLPGVLPVLTPAPGKVE
jgi:YegS/Rv2252/BmrU family lipid kinase